VVLTWTPKRIDSNTTRAYGPAVRFFVTGATGFIGRHLCARLAADGHAVVALVRSPARAESLQHLGVRLVYGDLSRFADPGFVLPACDVVVHAAAVITAERPADYDRINHQAVRDLIACIRRQDAAPRRLVFLSSLAAAGPSPADGTPLNEDDPPAPCDPYGTAKWNAERALSDAPFPVTSLRPPIVFGRGDTGTLIFFRAARWHLGFSVGVQKLSFVHVDDLVEAIVAVALDSSSAQRTYFVTATEDATASRLWRAISVALDRHVVVVPIPRGVLWLASRVATAASWLLPLHNPIDDKQYRQLIAPAFVCSSARLQRELGWRPRLGLDETIRRTVAGFRADGWL
jgi:dihydroflavonol-4-reductase